MSQVKLTLRPPPNVDFVNGYPGIPPGNERQQACVKGAIEVRAGPQGVKAKWVRVELRKVETIPGGGLSNTFYDFVGPSPVTLWTASDEYGMLRSQDFPFQIRIPESVPPSLALESGAGIKYELLASVCTKGKRGFLRRRKSSVISSQASVIVDKHELHSTWPVYCQPETRHITHEGVTLTVERNQTCFGPGERISVMATLRSDSTNTVLLRGFELSLRESTVFRGGPYASGKKTAPQVRTTTIDENKVPVNFNIYGGEKQTAELSCGVSPNHTTTSLNTARHIDITYILSVKALLGTGPLVMDLPVVLSNWQKNVSQEAVRRIGPVPSLSLTAPGPQQILPSRVDPAPTQSRPTTANAANYARPDEFGHAQSGRGTSPRADDVRNTTLPGRTPSATASNRFTVTNAPELNISTERETQVRRPSASGSGARNWPTAEEEKLKLYEGAKAKAEKVQGGVTGPSTAQQTTSPTSVTSDTRSRGGAWPTAEEEKLKLWNKAQDAVNRTQGEAFSATEQHRKSPPPSSRPSDNGSASNKKSFPSADQEKEALRRYNEAKQAVDRVQNPATDMGGSSSTSGSQYPSAEQEKAALRRYQEAVQAVERTQNTPTTATDVGGSSSAPPSRFLNAEQEKEALRRYNEAKEAVARTQISPADVGGSSSSSVPPPANDMPPPFEASSPPVDARMQLAEKDRLRRAYEEQDAAAARQQASYNDAPPPPFPEGSASIQTAIQEKEALRRKFAAQDAQANPRAQTKTPPPRGTSPPNPHTSYRPAPSPPAAGGSGSRILTASEEKAMLRARFEAENSRASVTPPPRTNGYTNGVNGSLSPSPSSPPASSNAPPPLMPKPPSRYIQETQEEDARVSRYAMNGTLPPNFDDYPPLVSHSLN
ncbi:hypothetical protein PQX77_000265 [Marasmius sp. AFHP31]|nr:hypothetical protein PQX77_000265 [Marasmius sp. AFHP31]